MSFTILVVTCSLSISTGECAAISNAHSDRLPETYRTLSDCLVAVERLDSNLRRGLGAAVQTATCVGEAG